MGIEILKSSIVHGKTLSGNAYKVLVVMSLSALDKPKDGRPASLYWGGWDGLAVALGHVDAARNSSGHKAVRRAIKELRDGRHISPMVIAHRGVGQSYMVHPGGLGKGGQSDPVKGGHSDPVKGGQSGPQSGAKMTPPRSTKDQGDLSEDISNQSVTGLQMAREDEKQQGGMGGHKFIGPTTGDDCSACGCSYLNRKAHPFRLLRGA